MHEDVLPLIFFLLFFLMPTITAFGRKHPKRGLILTINLFLGWTILCWFASFYWSLKKFDGSKESEKDHKEAKAGAIFGSILFLGLFIYFVPEPTPERLEAREVARQEKEKEAEALRLKKEASEKEEADRREQIIQYNLSKMKEGTVKTVCAVKGVAEAYEFVGKIEDMEKNALWTEAFQIYFKGLSQKDQDICFETRNSGFLTTLESVNK